MKSPVRPEIIISGLACRLPGAPTLEHFWQNLLSGAYAPEGPNDRWESNLHGIPDRFGRLAALDRFDAQFFEVHPKQAQKMDPQLRMLLEVSYEAFLDAGINPFSLKGSDTGVFVGSHAADSQGHYVSKLETMTGYENTGCSLNMFSNRLSFFYDFHGPSQTVDTACSSSIVALDAAAQAIATGRCTHAIVAGSNLILRPGVSLGFKRLTMLSPTGFSRPFDAAADGYVRSEGVVAIVLSAAPAARRRRAVLLGTGVNSDGYTREGITFPNAEAQTALLERVYREAGVDPRQVAYFEAHGTGTQAGDPQEVRAIDAVIAGGRQGAALPIGSVKSNLGHCEGASGLAGLAKVLLAMDRGLIPANIGYSEPNPAITAIREGRVKVVDQHLPWEGGIVGLNSFGFGGTNAHAVLSGGPRSAPAAKPSSEGLQVLPVTSRTEASQGRTAEAIRAASHQARAEVGPYLRAISGTPLRKHPHRSAFVVDDGGFLAEVMAPSQQAPGPVWYVFSGMGAQWPAMGKQFLRVPVLRESLERCAAALRPHDYDLMELLCRPDADAFASVLASLVGLTAMQVAMVDALAALGVRPDGMLGHSQGEIPCAYADGALTLEQAMEIAYERGRCLQLSPGTDGSMAAATMSWAEAQALEAPGVYAACHNGPRSVTLSGKREAIQRVVEELTRREIEVREVDSSGIAFHSPHLASALEPYRVALERIIPEPKARSARWVSTCLDEDAAKTEVRCDADYFVANLANPVRFHDALKRVPAGATVVELAAHTLLRSLILESVPQVRYAGLSRRGFDNAQTFYQGAAQLFAHGHDLDWSALHAPSACVEPPLSGFPGVEWDHSEEWEVATHEAYGRPAGSDAARIFDLALTGEEFGFVADHVLNGSVVFPGVGYLYLVWRTLAEQQGRTVDQLPICFRDVVFHRATTVPADCAVRLCVRWLPTTEHFELSEGDTLVASGTASVQGVASTWPDAQARVDSLGERSYLSSDELYRELRLRGYDFGPAFKTVRRVSLDGAVIDVEWSGNWVTFLDAFLHSSIVKLDRQTVVPTRIRRMEIDPARVGPHAVLSVFSEPHVRKIFGPGVLVEGADFTVVAGKRAELREYQRTISQYVTRSALAITQRAPASAEHLKKLERALRSVAPAPDAGADLTARVERYLAHPDAHMLRLAHHLFSSPEKLLTDPMPHIVSFAGYYTAYRQDMLAAHLFSGGALEELFTVVRENVAFGRPMQICELGAGTGGLTSHLLALLDDPSDRYLVTDVSSGYFVRLKHDFAEHGAFTDYGVWDVNRPAPTALAQLEPDLLVASNTLHVARNLSETLPELARVLRPGGFLLLHENTQAFESVIGMWGFIRDFWEISDGPARELGPLLGIEGWRRALRPHGLELVSVKSDGCQLSLMLFRKLSERSTPALRLVFDESRPQSLEELQRGLQEVAQRPDQRLWIEGSAATAPGLLGLVNCVRKEPYGSQVRCLYTEGATPITGEMRRAASAGDLVTNVFDASGVHGSYRHRDYRPSPTIVTDNAVLQVGARGDLSSVEWVEAAEHLRGRCVIQPSFFALNFKDVMLATGRLPPNAFDGPLAKAFAGEFSGVTNEGRRVMGFLNHSLQTKISLDHDFPPFLWDVPKHWSLEEAATVPVAYMTAYLALVLRAGMKSGDRVLIHAGAGAVGQAAIRIALAEGCEVFATAGSEEKRAFLLRMFPQLKADHIGSSRDDSFEPLVMNATHGAGVDIVLNSLAGELLQASLRVLARFGRFLEIGKLDMSRDTAIGMQLLLKDRQVHGVGVNNIMLVDNGELAQLNRLLSEGIAKEIVQPLPRTLFPRSDIEGALRYMAQGKHVGKVVVSLGSELPTTPLRVEARRRFECDPEHTYLITGGLGGFGLELCDWLIRRGAKRLVLTSRSGPKSAYQRYLLETFRKRGVDLRISTADVCSGDQADMLLAELEREAPVGGIFHLAMVLEDAFFATQEVDAFSRVCRVKLGGARNLDASSRQLCPSLKHFVVFSSLAGGMGNPSQSAYGYANFGVDRLCADRRSRGLPGLSVQWGAVGDVGYYFENKHALHVETLRCKEQGIGSCLRSLETFLLGEAPVTASYVKQPRELLEVRAERADESEERTFATLVRDLKRVLGLAPTATLEQGVRLSDLGMDSLMGVELVQKLERDYGLRLPLNKIGGVTLKELEAHFAKDPSAELPAARPVGPAPARGPLPLFDVGVGGLERGKVIYFLTGILADPAEALLPYVGREDVGLVAVRYEQSIDVTDLAERWRAHVDALPPGTTLVKVLGYSAGAAIVHRLAKLGTFEGRRFPVELTTISPPRETIFTPLKYLKLADLEQLTDDEMVQRLKALSVWGDYAMLPLRDIRHQLRFLLREPFYREEKGRVHRIVLPKDDPECWSRTQAEAMAHEVVSVAGGHDIRQVDLGQFF